jgi:hypothetical protein
MRPAVLMRLLAVITFAECVLATWAILRVISNYPMNRRYYGAEYAHFSSMYFFLVLVNCIFTALLLRSAILQWWLSRKGLKLLAFTLGFEVLYFIIGGIAAVRWYPMSGDRMVRMATSVLIGASGISLYFQAITAYPLIAIVLIILSFRALRRPTPDSVQAGGSSC